jgi:catechol 2,3-dioxygenase-like lactoylglutathione lyase family enzyme
LRDKASRIRRLPARVRPGALTGVLPRSVGFDVHSSVDYGEGVRWVEVVPPGAATVIALNGPGDQRPGFEPGIRAPFSLETDDFDAAMAELAGRGVRFDEPIRMPPPVPPMVVLRDPDDNQILLIQRDA